MEIFLKITLYIHIAAGFMALVTAPVAMAVQKGGNAHRKWGKVFFYGMTIVTITAIIIASFKYIPFLLMLSIFSYYSIIKGYRALYLKERYRGQKPALIDWLSAGLTGIFSLGLLIWGILILISGFSFGWVAVVFGTIGVTNVYGDIRKFRNPPKAKMSWWFEHLNGFVGGYIATVTAFSATNLSFLPPLVAWLFPTVIIIPIMVYWNRKYQKQFGIERKAVRS
jgi:uncharacterized membrane protein